jgi:hypothetical protein
MGLFELDQAGFEALFEVGERGGGHGANIAGIGPICYPKRYPDAETGATMAEMCHFSSKD